MFRSRYLSRVFSSTAGLVPLHLWSRCEFDRRYDRVMVTGSTLQPPLMIASHPSKVRSVFTPHEDRVMVGIHLQRGNDQYATLFPLTIDVITQADNVFNQFISRPILDSCNIIVFYRHSQIPSKDEIGLEVIGKLVKFLESWLPNCTISQVSYWDIKSNYHINLSDVVNLSLLNRYTDIVRHNDDGTEEESTHCDRLATIPCKIEIVLDPDPSKSHYRISGTEIQP